MPRVVFVSVDGGQRWEIDAPVGATLMQVAIDAGLDMEGACEGQMACSTCHVIVDEAFYDRLAEPSEDEEDMLDLAAGLCATSRLACQIVLRAEDEGLTVRLPAQSHNMLGF
jgi:2Fe-2S ferredoxin